ncbi:MAG: hypothetical protein ACK5XX_06475 [Holosporales bacterium]
MPITAPLQLLHNVDDDTERAALRYRLSSTDFGELEKLCIDAQAALHSLNREGYSEEHQKPYRMALLEVLLELRIRGYEADYDGFVYPSPMLYVVPEQFRAARLRQIHRLRKMPTDHVGHLCLKTMKNLLQIAQQTSKTILTGTRRDTRHGTHAPF